MTSLSLLAICFVQFLSVYGWNYNNLGPDAWPFISNECGATAQSPIDIITESAISDNTLTDIKFNNYDQNIKFKLTVDSFTVKAEPDYTGITSKPTISGSNYVSSYELLQFHFHWGQNNFQGSEHEVNGKKYPLELHLVHINPALENKIKLAVLGFLFEVSDTSNPQLSSFVAGSKSIPQNSSFTVTLNLASLLPSAQVLNSNGYYRYGGSLTTPPCSEWVVWTVFNTYLPVQASLLTDLRSIQAINFREPQPLNKRTVYKSLALSSSNRVYINYLMFALTFVLVLLK